MFLLYYHRSWYIIIGLGLEMLPSAYGLGQYFQDLSHSFSPYGPPSRQITYIYIYISYCTVPCYIHVWYCMITNSSDFGFLFCSVLSNKINEKQLNEEFLLKIASAKSHWEELEKYVFLLLYATLVTWLHLKHPYMQILFRGEDLLYL